MRDSVPATIGYYNLVRRDAPLTLVRGSKSTPAVQWEVAVGLRKLFRTML
jgi:hypothetical protein